MDFFIRAVKGFALTWLFILWLPAIAVGIVLALLFKAIDKAGHPDPSRLQKFFSLFIGLLLWLLDKFGLMKCLPPKGNIPDGPFVVVANHPGLFDVLVLINTIPHMSVMVARKLSYKIPITKIIDQSGYVFSGGNGSPLEAVAKALKMLKTGYKYQMFPEGTRSPVNGLLPFNPGALRIAEKAGVPVLPVIIRNDPPFLDKTEKWYFPMRQKRQFQLEFLEPFMVKKGKSRKMTKELEQMYKEALGVG